MCSFRGCSSTGFTQKAGLDRHNKNATFWHCPTKRNQLLQESTLSPDVYTCSSLGATVATRYSYLSRWGCPALHSVEVAWYESPSGASPAQFLMAFPLMFLPCARLRGRDFSRCLTHLAPPPPHFAPMPTATVLLCTCTVETTALSPLAVSAACMAEEPCRRRQTSAQQERAATLPSTGLKRSEEQLAQTLIRHTSQNATRLMITASAHRTPRFPKFKSATLPFLA